ncbi:MAG: hypothetical protein HYX88_02155 [Chloroflexi bacterium]|nr:hypothetical protein [Chloroflexota bacterium]
MARGGDVSTLFYERGWTDGLPIVPPTDEAVAEMLTYTDRDPQEVIALLPPKMGQATIEKIAINAVMAGCLSTYLPIIVTAVQAIIAEEFNLYGIQATTEMTAPLIIINGPIGEEIGVNAGSNTLGQGWRSNATIGRALRLILMNIGGGLPGPIDKATHGQPGKFTYCMAENARRSPWEPLHVERGFRPEDSTVTVVGADAPYNINDHGSTSAQDLLTTISNTMAVPGSNNALAGGEPLVVLGPEHAAIIAGDGWAKKEVKKFIFEKARLPLERFSAANQRRLPTLRPDWVGKAKGPFLLPLADRAEDIMVLVAGGAGKHSLFIPTFGTTRAVTRAVALKDGTPARSIEDFRQR